MPCLSRGNRQRHGRQEKKKKGTRETGGNHHNHNHTKVDLHNDLVKHPRLTISLL